MTLITPRMVEDAVWNGADVMLLDWGSQNVARLLNEMLASEAGPTSEEPRPEALDISSL